MAVRMVNAIARTIPTVAAFSAMCPLLVPSRRIFMGNNRRRCVSYFTLSLATLSQLTRQPNGAAEALVRHILNWGPEEKAPPKRGLKCTGITPLRGRRASAAGQFATRQLVPERKAPRAKDSHAWGYTKGHSIQTPPVHIRGPTRSKLG